MPRLPSRLPPPSLGVPLQAVPAPPPSPYVRTGVVREHPTLGTWGWELETNRGHCSAQACAVLGVPRGFTPTLEQLLACFAPEYRDWLKATFLRCIQDGRGFDLEAEVVRAGGRRVRVRLTCEAEWDPAAGCQHLLGAVQDVTPSLQVQMDLRESQRALDMLIGNLPGMAYRCSNGANWPLQFASDGAWELTGYSPAQLVGGEPRYGDLIHPSDLDHVWSVVQDGLARRERFQLTYRIRTVWGEKWVWEQGCGVFESDGRLRCIEGFVSDVTQARQVQAEMDRLNRSLEARVRERTAQLEHANAELEAFAYSIAHDLRAPMTSLAGFARLLEQAMPAAEGRSLHFLRRILGNVTQMSELTDAMLALARLSGVDIQHEAVDLAQLARAAVEHLREQEPQRPVELVLPARLPGRGDRRLLQQVLSNLIGNAWKFSRHREAVYVEVGNAAGEGPDVFYVRDRGVGFDMGHAAQLFGAFRRLHGSDEFEGTGIGLALVRKIVHRHGGRVWAESQPGVGTTIFFTLPAPDPAGPVAAARPGADDRVPA